MITQPSKQAIQALATLDGDLHFEVVKQWLRTTLNELNEQTPYSKDEVQTRWNQGAQQLLQEFLQRADNAQETIRKF